jgi:voltage-gated potassium channel
VSPEVYGLRLDRWERAVEWPLTLAAVVFFVAYAAQILARPLGALEALAEGVIWVTWAMFLVDYVVRLFIANHRWQWFYRHLLDLAVVALPMLRPLRLMRFLTIIALVQRGAGGKFRGRVVEYTAAATVLVVVIGGLAIYDAERDTGNITSFGDALWWAFVTITTVGYGDYFPETVNGRIVAVGMMVGGVALIGVITATLASWIVEKVSDAAKPKAAATAEQVDALRQEIAELKGLVSSLVPSDARESEPERRS